jgi:hypothetical protein
MTAKEKLTLNSDRRKMRNLEEFKSFSILLKISDKMSDKKMKETEKTVAALMEREKLIKDYFTLVRKPN